MRLKALDLKPPVLSHVFQVRGANLKPYFHEAYLSMFVKLCGQSTLEDENDVCAVPDGDGDGDGNVVASGYDL
jgi:hypothetical protein